jgi:hypothetical protein
MAQDAQGTQSTASYGDVSPPVAEVHVRSSWTNCKIFVDHFGLCTVSLLL